MTNETETKTPYFRMVAVGPAKEAPVEGKKPRPEVEASAKLLTEKEWDAMRAIPYGRLKDYLLDEATRRSIERLTAAGLKANADKQAKESQLKVKQ